MLIRAEYDDNYEYENEGNINFYIIIIISQVPTEIFLDATISQADARQLMNELLVILCFDLIFSVL